MTLLPPCRRLHSPPLWPWIPIQLHMIQPLEPSRQLTTLPVFFLASGFALASPIGATAFSAVLHDSRSIMHGEFVTLVRPNIPTDNPAGGILPYSPPPSSDAANICQLCERLIDTLGDATAYSEDLLIVLQNLLLGDLFEQSVPARLPIDSTKRAITLDRADELETWFRATTDWGRHTAEIEAETLTRFAPQPAPSSG